MELPRPMRTFKVKGLGSPGNPGQLRDRGGRFVPVNIEGDALGIRPGNCGGWSKHFEKKFYAPWQKLLILLTSPIEFQLNPRRRLHR